MDHEIRVGDVYEFLTRDCLYIVTSVTDSDVLVTREDGTKAIWSFGAFKESLMPVPAVCKYIVKNNFLLANAYGQIVLFSPGDPLANLGETTFMSLHGKLKILPPVLFDLVTSGKIEFLVGKTGVASVVPNTTNEICNYCNGPTEPMIGKMRICRKCEK